MSDATGRLILLNGPSGVGKSTAAKLLHESVGRDGGVAVIEHDHFADMVGAQIVPATGPLWDKVWEKALPPTMSACRAFLNQGVTVVLVITYGSQSGQETMMRELGYYNPLQLMLLPTWEVAKSRIEQRIKERNSDRELDNGGWSNTKAFYDELAAMAKADAMDVVLDTTNLDAAGSCNSIRATRHGLSVMAASVAPAP